MTWKNGNISVSSHCDLRSSFVHNYRLGNHHTENIDEDRMNQNLYFGVMDDSLDLKQIDFEDRKKVYNPKKCFKEFYKDPLEEWNAKQKRKDRKKTMEEYYKDTKPENRMKEFVFQVGRFDDTKEMNNDEIEDMKSQQLEMNLEYIKTFEERNPHMKLICATVHTDETSIHTHCIAMPFCTDMKLGLSVQPSWYHALRQDAGLTNEQVREPGKKKSYNLFGDWRKREDDYIDNNLLASRGYKRDYVESRQENITPKRYREMVKEVTEKVEQLKSEREILKEEIKAVNKSLRRRESELEETGKELSEVRKENFELKQENRDLLRYTKKYEEQLEESKALAKEMEEKASKMVQAVNVAPNIATKKLYTNNDIKALTEQNKNLQVQSNLKEHEIEDLQKSVRNEQSEKYQEQNKNRDLKEKLQEKEHENHVLTKQLDYASCKLGGIETVVKTLEMPDFICGDIMADIGKAIQANNIELFNDIITDALNNEGIEIDQDIKEKINDTRQMMRKRENDTNNGSFIDQEYSEELTAIEKYENGKEYDNAIKNINEKNFDVLNTVLNNTDLTEPDKEQVITDILAKNRDINVTDLNKFVENKCAMDIDATKQSKPYITPELEKALDKHVELKKMNEIYSSRLVDRFSQQSCFPYAITSEYANLVKDNSAVESNKVSQRLKIEEAERLKKKRLELEEEERLRRKAREREQEFLRQKSRGYGGRSL